MATLRRAMRFLRSWLFALHDVDLMPRDDSSAAQTKPAIIQRIPSPPAIKLLQ